MKFNQGRIAIVCGVLLAASSASAQEYWIAENDNEPVQIDAALQGDAAATGSGCIGCDSVWDQSNMNAACGGGGCGNGCGAGGCGNWFFSLNGLVFNRDNDDDVMLTFQTGDGEPLLTTRDAEMDWSGGFEARFGRYFNCGRNAIEASYWGIYPSAQTSTVFAAGALGDLNTPLTFDSLVIPGSGLNVIDFFNAGTAQLNQVRRSYEAHNVEVNLLGLAGFGGAGGCCGSSCGGCGGGLTFTYLLGPRLLRFSENMLFASDVADTTFTGTADELAYIIDVKNSLVGFQLGGRADWCLGRRLGLYSGIKFGIYGNEMRQCQTIQDGLGDIAEVTAGPFAGEFYDIKSRGTDFSTLGELDLGMALRISPCWSVNLGYRVVGVSGVALAPSQIPRSFFDNLQEVRRIDSNGDLILHGGYAGLNFNY